MYIPNFKAPNLLGFGTALTAGGLVLRQFREFLASTD